MERYLRTQYHRIAGSRYFIERRIKSAQDSYRIWLKRQHEEGTLQKQSAEIQPGISFFLSFTIANTKLAIQTIDSIRHLKPEKWELILQLQDDSPVDKTFESVITSDHRIRKIDDHKIDLVGMVDQCHGDYFICCSPGDTFEPDFLISNGRILNDHPLVDILYCDVDFRNEMDDMPKAFFKPEKFSPELLLSINYLSRSLIRKETAKKIINPLHLDASLINQEWELVFLMCEKPVQIFHNTRVGVHQIKPDQDGIDLEHRMMHDHLQRIGITKTAELEKRAGENHLLWKFTQPSVSIVIPSKNHAPLLKRLLNSVFQLTTYSNFEIILVDNQSRDKDLLDYYEELQKEHPVRIVHYDEEFNYSKAINLGAAASKADFLLFLNNDMEILSDDWLEEMVRWAMIPEIGVVGTKLLYEDDRIQHAGIVLGLQGFVGHLYLNTPRHYFGLLGSVDWYRNVSAVTGACQMVRRNVFQQLNGYDEKFKLVFNDVDFCLRAIDHGYRNLYNPFVEIRHFEGRSRGYSSPCQDLIRGYDLLTPWILRDDPYFSPNLTYTNIPHCQLKKNDFQQRLNLIYERKHYIR